MRFLRALTAHDVIQKGRSDTEFVKRSFEELIALMVDGFPDYQTENGDFDYAAIAKAAGGVHCLTRPVYR